MNLFFCINLCWLNCNGAKFSKKAKTVLKKVQKLIKQHKIKFSLLFCVLFLYFLLFVFKKTLIISLEEKTLVTSLEEKKTEFPWKKLNIGLIYFHLISDEKAKEIIIYLECEQSILEKQSTRDAAAMVKFFSSIQFQCFQLKFFRFFFTKHAFHWADMLKDARMQEAVNKRQAQN